MLAVMRAMIGLLVGLWLAAIPAVAGASPPASVRVPSEPDALAYAPGHVLWVTHKFHGPLVVHHVPATGGPASVLVTIGRAHPASDNVAVSLAATANGYVIAARDGRLITTGECGCDYDVSEGELVVRGGYDGSSSTLVNCAPRRNDDEQPALQVAAGTSGYALSGVRCGTAAAVDTISGEGVVAPITGITPAVIGAISFAEPFVAIEGTAAGAPKTTSVHVFDTVGGARRDLPDAAERRGGPFQVLADGSLLIGNGSATDVPKGTYVWPPGVPAPQLLSAANLGVAGAGRMLFGREPIAGAEAALGLADLDGSSPRTVGAPGAGITRIPFYLDATVAAFLNRSCSGAAQMTTVDLADATTPAAPDGCPVSMQSSTVTFDHKGRGTLLVTCPNGCHSDVQLYISLHPKQLSTHDLNRYVDTVFDSRLAIGKLNLNPSTTAQRVAVRLKRPAITLMRRYHRSLRVFPSVGYSGDIGVGPELPLPIPTITAKLRR
jgi:hypothetical protein